MDTAKNILLRLIEEMPEKQIPEVIDFVGYLRNKNDKEIFKDLENVSETSLAFWINEKDDEVWNNA